MPGAGILSPKELPVWGSLPNTVSLWHVNHFFNFASWLVFFTVLTDCDHLVSTDGSDLPTEILVMISPSKGWCKSLTWLLIFKKRPRTSVSGVFSGGMRNICLECYKEKNTSACNFMCESVVFSKMECELLGKIISFSKMRQKGQNNYHRSVGRGFLKHNVFHLSVSLCFILLFFWGRGRRNNFMPESD